MSETVSTQEQTTPVYGMGTTPFEVASTMFGMYAPKLEQLLKNLSTGQLRRLVNALVQYPINEKEFIDDSQTLKDAFHMGQSLLEAKWLMTMHTLMEQGLLQQTSQTDVEVNKQETSDNEKEVSNG